MKKIISTIVSGLLIVTLLFLVFVAYGSANNRWYKIIKIEGNSMAPTLRFGDAVVLTHATEKIPAGTIITMAVNGELVTHRLISDYSGGMPETKGDANDTKDSYNGCNVQIVGIVRLRIPWLGYPSMYIRYLLNKV